MEEEIEVLKKFWKGNRDLICPRCGSPLNLVAMYPKTKEGSLQVSYETFIECENCSFSIRVDTSKVYGAVKAFDDRTIDISSWSPSGAREIMTYENLLGKEKLEYLFETGKLVEFLIVNDKVVAVME